MQICYPTMRIRKDEMKLPEKPNYLYKRLPWPENLITEIDPNLHTPLSANQMEGLYFALDSLSERERQMILCRYKDQMVFREIGEKFGVKEEPTRQIIFRGVWKLTDPSISRYYREGYHKAIEIERDRKEKILETADRKEKIELLSEIYIGEAVFSTRASNSLRRAGMTTLGDVACTKQSELLKIRNVGEMIVAEIKRVLADYGFQMEEK